MKITSKDLTKLKHKQCKDFTLSCYSCVVNASVEVLITELEYLKWAEKEVKKFKKVAKKPIGEYKKLVKKIIR